MNLRLTVCLCLALSYFLPAQASAEPPLPGAWLLPKHETGASQFVKQNPAYDGRGVVVAIFDTGVDPGAEGLRVTTDGKPKVIDMVDATGSGDVDMATKRKVEADTVEGLTGRTLKLDPAWLKTSREVRLGMKTGYELFPSSLVGQLKQRRRKKMLKKHRQLELKLRDALAHAKNGEQRKEAAARVAQLEFSLSKVADPGPVFDCLMFRRDNRWYAVVDTDEDADLRDETPLTTFRHSRTFATFQEADLNFAVNFYEDGDVLSLVTDAGSHATHVAGIVAANYPDQPERNGLAPGAQIVSVKIGDRRIVSMETAVALQRGLRAALNANCDLINMSYGEPSMAPNQGPLMQEIARAVNDKGVVFVASAGNDGPALSTAGSPGATSTPVLGIGAYLSPEMMQAAYSVRKKLPPTMYGFSSRGPAFDGDLGVDLIAPGGAVAPVPVWSRTRSMRMNGTSMAAPNATGAIAVVLSAAKAEKTPYTPASVERALKHSAHRVEGIDRFAQGAGLIQCGPAFDYLKEHAADTGEQLPVTVRLSNGDRGVYLRDAQQLKTPHTISVSVSPQFKEQAPTAERIAFEIPLQISTTADWVRAGRGALMTSNGARFEIEVDPRQLPPGAHFAEVLLHDTTSPQRGPVASVPVSVIVPSEMKDKSENGAAAYRETLALKPSALHRRFFAVPAWASWAEVTCKLVGDGPAQILGLHAVQCERDDSFEQHQRKTRMRLSPGEVVRQRFDVLPGRTLETCFSQYFGALDESQVEIEVSFQGARVEPSTVLLPPGGEAEVAVVANASAISLAPAARLTTRRQVIPPSSSSINLLPAGRDLTVDGDRRFELQLTYKFEQKSATQITPHWPREDGFLYESEFGGYLWNLYDAQGRRVATDDSMPDPVRVKPGEYTLRLRVRHPKLASLERLKKTVLWLDSPLKSAVNLKISNSRLAAAAGRSAARNRLRPGDRQRLVIQAPATTPAGLNPGDLLLGRFDIQADPDRKPGGYRLSYAAPAATAASKKAEKPAAKKPLAEQIRQLKIERLRSLPAMDHAEADTLLKDILSDSPGNLEALYANLQRMDTIADRKKHLEKVVAAVDAILKEVDLQKLQSHHNQKKPVAKGAENTKLNRQREIVIDALYRKGRALGYMELPEVLEKHPIKNKQQHDQAFNENFEMLGKWVDTTGKDYVLLHIRWLRRKERYGEALALVNKLIAEQPVNFWYHKKRRDIFKSLGWKDLADYESNWLLIRFPQTYEKL